MGVTAAVIGTAVTAKTASDSARKARKAQDRRSKEAKEDATESEIQARKAEVFAETEGKGQGQLGQIRSGLSAEIDDEEETEIRQGKSARSSTFQI